MKIVFLLIAIICSLIACNKTNNSGENIATDDLIATTAMTSELSNMEIALSNLKIAPNISQRLYWDSAYHHHNSLFWHHHNIYHHNTYSHDDHSHHWAPYDPAINHHGHHHPQYPGHLNDSLVITTNNHHHTNCEHHPGHHICHHHTIDSLHHVHNLHHP